MSAKRIGLSLLLIGFLGLSLYAVGQYGYVGFFAAAAFANVATFTVFTDLVIALSLVMVWMWADARERGVNPIPYVVLTFVLGSVGPLLYLLRRAGHAPARPVRFAAEGGHM